MTMNDAWDIPVGSVITDWTPASMVVSENGVPIERGHVYQGGQLSFDTSNLGCLGNFSLNFTIEPKT